MEVNSFELNRFRVIIWHISQILIQITAVIVKAISCHHHIVTASQKTRPNSGFGTPQKPRWFHLSVAFIIFMFSVWITVTHKFQGSNLEREWSGGTPWVWDSDTVWRAQRISDTAGQSLDSSSHRVHWEHRTRLSCAVPRLTTRGLHVCWEKHWSALIYTHECKSLNKPFKADRSG